MRVDDLSNLISKKLNNNSEYLNKIFFSSNSITKTKFFILDNLLPDEIALKIFKNFPSKNEWVFKNTFREKKYTYVELEKIENSIVKNFTNALVSKEVVSQLSKITNIKSLESDPKFNMQGLSRLDRLNYLDPHIDNSHDITGRMYRRLNILYYLTPKIKEQDGGNLELWDENVKQPIKIVSSFNRLVVMETNKSSWHSVDPIKSDISRYCISNYYFSKNSPYEIDYKHVTTFLSRPEKKFYRIFNRLDNMFRQTISNLLKISRTKFFKY